MKKTLLLLSCCLATWCSVHAGLKSSASSSEVVSARTNVTMLNSTMAAYGQSSGQITSASYDANNNTMFVRYSLSGASSAKLRLLQTRTGRIVNEYSLSVNATSTTIRVYTRAYTNDELYVDEGQYVLLLVVDGNVRSNMNIQITAKGKINSFSPSLDNKKLTVSYTIEHASTYSRTLRIEGSDFREYLPYPNTTNSYTFDSSKLTPGKTYTFKLYSGDNLLNTMKYTMPMPAGELASVSYDPDEDQYSFFANYKLKYARNPEICIYDNGGKKLLKRVAISNSSTNTRFKVENVVEPNNYYQVCICENGNKLTPLMQLSTHIVAPRATKIDEIRFENGNRFWLKFSVQNAGVNIGFKLISTNTGKSYDYNWGYCTQSQSDYYLYLPSSDCRPGIYVVLLMENNQIKDSKQIYINK